MIEGVKIEYRGEDCEREVILKVNGIGERSMEKLRQLLFVVILMSVKLEHIHVIPLTEVLRGHVLTQRVVLPVIVLLVWNLEKTTFTTTGIIVSILMKI